jgi:hypothetical protein
MRWLVLAAIPGAIAACGSIADRLEVQSGPGLRLGDNAQQSEPPSPSVPDAHSGVSSDANTSPAHDAGHGNASHADSGPPPNDAGRDGVSDASTDGAPATFLTDAYAPLPPAQDGGGFNAIFVEANHWLYLPLFSMPSCEVIPPYGECYVVKFETGGPSGVFPSCSPGSGPCYTVSRMISLDLNGYMQSEEDFANGRYELSSFDDAGIAVGMMDTKDGLVPLAVKRCP